MGNKINKITHKELKKNLDEYILISIYTHVEDVILGTVFCSEEDYYIENAIQKKQKIVFYGFDQKDVKYFNHLHAIYGKIYDNIYFYENGLYEWMKLRRIYGNKEYPIFRYV
jgi:hypothetical protein